MEIVKKILTTTLLVLMLGISQSSFSHDTCKKWKHIRLWQNFNTNNPLNSLMKKIDVKGIKGWKLIQVDRLDNGSMIAYMNKCDRI